MIYRLTTFLLLINTFLCIHAQKLVKVKGECTYQLPENVSLEDGKIIALERAKTQALADAFGTIITQRNSTIIENSEKKTALDFLSLGGSEIKGEWIETLGEPNFQIISENGMIAIKVEVKGKAREIKSADICFEAHLLRNGTTIKNESTEFHNGDDLYLYFKSPVNGYLAVYLLDHTSQEVFCILPYRSSGAPSYQIEHDKPYIFFSSQLSENDPGEVDEYVLTCKKTIEQNTIYILFSPNLFTKASTQEPSKNMPRQLSYIEFQKWLGKCKAKDTMMQNLSATINIKE